MSSIARRVLLALVLLASVLVTTAVIGASTASARCAPTESFTINYSHTTTTTTGFTYSVTIPKDRTGRMLRLHRADRITILQTLRGEDCVVHRSTQYAYLPRASSSIGNYCTIRDLTPAMGRWKGTCSNSD